MALGIGAIGTPLAAYDLTSARSSLIEHGGDLGAIRLDQSSDAQLHELSYMQIADGAANTTRALTLHVISDIEHGLQQGSAGLSDKVSGFVKGLDTSIERIDSSIGEIRADIDAVADMAMHAPDDATLAALQRKMNRLSTDLTAMFKEREKQDSLRSLTIQVICGHADPSTISKLRELGLGNLVEQFLRTLLKYVRATQGKVPAGVIAGLAAAGLGHLVRLDAQSYAFMRWQNDQRTRGFGRAPRQAVQGAELASAGGASTYTVHEATDADIHA